MIYGYCRCSTNESKQDITRQIKELQTLGVAKNNIFREYESSIKLNRVELNRILNIVNPGDTIVATEVSRITRSTKQLCDIIEIAKNKKLKLIFGTFVVDCTKDLDSMTEGMLKMMGVFAEMERNMISERVKSGIVNARSKGKLTVNDIPKKVLETKELYDDGLITKTDYAKICNVSRPTLNKYLSLISDNK